MATIEEIDDLSVEIINGVNEEDETPRESQSSPARAESSSQAPVTIPATDLVTSSRVEEECEDEDDEIDETILERIIALHEMFPLCVQNATSKLVHGSVSAVKGFYSFARSASWIFFSTSAILFAPILFEVERSQMEEMQKQQQRQILLGPGAAMSGGSHPGMVPGMAPPPPR